ncbi:hypothetical protein ANCDUO_01333 [Ancylostoma duodenale]|uniref:Uncharacterized protein n=1 Tax=Ancylostoma duodenale TaxID=51022 RepID=A0A0C2H9M1_9BILA|nr:hypothetical protein ANCDUO_01333 [Ancylostoma duodenale]
MDKKIAQLRDMNIGQKGRYTRATRLKVRKAYVLREKTDVNIYSKHKWLCLTKRGFKEHYNTRICAHSVQRFSRIKRILPLYYVTIIGILVALISLLPTTYRGVNDGSSTKAIFLISNSKKQDADSDYERENQQPDVHANNNKYDFETIQITMYI